MHVHLQTKYLLVIEKYGYGTDQCNSGVASGLRPREENFDNPNLFSWADFGMPPGRVEELTRKMNKTDHRLQEEQRY